MRTVSALPMLLPVDKLLLLWLLLPPLLLMLLLLLLLLPPLVLAAPRCDGGVADNDATVEATTAGALLDDNDDNGVESASVPCRRAGESVSERLACLASDWPCLSASCDGDGERRLDDAVLGSECWSCCCCCTVCSWSLLRRLRFFSSRSLLLLPLPAALVADDLPSLRERFVAADDEDDDDDDGAVFSAGAPLSLLSNWEPGASEAANRCGVDLLACNGLAERFLPRRCPLAAVAADEASSESASLEFFSSISFRSVDRGFAVLLVVVLLVLVVVLVLVLDVIGAAAAAALGVVPWTLDGVLVIGCADTALDADDDVVVVVVDFFADDDEGCVTTVPPLFEELLSLVSLLREDFSLRLLRSLLLLFVLLLPLLDCCWPALLDAALLLAVLLLASAAGGKRSLFLSFFLCLCLRSDVDASAAGRSDFFSLPAVVAVAGPLAAEWAAAVAALGDRAGSAAETLGDIVLLDDVALGIASEPAVAPASTTAFVSRCLSLSFGGAVVVAAAVLFAVAADVDSSAETAAPATEAGVDAAEFGVR